MRPFKWKDVLSASHLPAIGYVTHKWNGKFAWYFCGEFARLTIKPITLKAKTLRGAKTEAIKLLKRQLKQIAEALP
jgi:hypothetical protein